jgi:hypothetical protein
MATMRTATFQHERRNAMTQLRTGRRWSLGLLVAVGLLGMPGRAGGEALADIAQSREVQVVAPSPTPRTCGTTSVTAHVIGASEFDSFSSTFSHGYHAVNSHFVVSTAIPSLTWVRLPAGAIVTSVELEGCDTDQFEEIELRLLRVPSPAGIAQNVTPSGITGAMAMLSDAASSA